MQPPVDEQGRGAASAAGQSTVGVGLDPLAHRLAIQVGQQLAPIQPELVGIAQEVGVLQGLLTVEQQLVHGPEAALERGRLDKVGGGQGMRMDAGKGQLAEHEPQLASELLLQPLDGPEGPRL